MPWFSSLIKLSHPALQAHGLCQSFPSFTNCLNCSAPYSIGWTWTEDSLCHWDQLLTGCACSLHLFYSGCNNLRPNVTPLLHASLFKYYWKGIYTFLPLLLSSLLYNPPGSFLWGKYHNFIISKCVFSCLSNSPCVYLQVHLLAITLDEQLLLGLCSGFGF